MCYDREGRDRSTHILYYMLLTNAVYINVLYYMGITLVKIMVHLSVSSAPQALYPNVKTRPRGFSPGAMTSRSADQSPARPLP